MTYFVDPTSTAHIMYAPPPHEAYKHKGQLVVFIDPDTADNVYRIGELLVDDPKNAVAVRPNGQLIIAIGGTIDSLEELAKAAYALANSLYFALKVRSEVIALPSFDMLMELCEI